MNDGQWITVNGTHIFVRDGETSKEAVERNFGKGSYSLTNQRKKGIIQLPRDEYAKLNSAVRTRYGNKIPKEKGIFMGDFYYKFSYNKSTEKIVCKQKVKIEGNEEAINRFRRDDE